MMTSDRKCDSKVKWNLLFVVVWYQFCSDLHCELHRPAHTLCVATAGCVIRLWTEIEGKDEKRKRGGSGVGQEEMRFMLTCWSERKGFIQAFVRTGTITRDPTLTASLLRVFRFYAAIPCSFPSFYLPLSLALTTLWSPGTSFSFILGLHLLQFNLSCVFRTPFFFFLSPHRFNTQHWWMCDSLYLFNLPYIVILFLHFDIHIEGSESMQLRCVSLSSVHFFIMAPTCVITHNAAFYHKPHDIQGYSHKQQANKLASFPLAKQNRSVYITVPGLDHFLMEFGSLNQFF